jgi:dTDP-glucose 4,6-dehydratase
LLPEPAGYTDVIHAAADTHLPGPAVEWVEQIVGGTASMLDFAVRCGAQRFLHTSSGAVYGTPPVAILEIPEEYSGAPSTGLHGSTYGQAKRVAEQLCTIYAQESGLPTINARCFAFAGRHLPLQGPYALGNFVQDALRGDVIRVKGDGTAIRSYLDGEDMACWLLTLLQDGVAGQSYNVGSSIAISIRQLAERVRDTLSPDKPIQIEAVHLGHGVTSRYVPCTHKALALGLRQTISLDASILRMGHPALP